MTTVVIVNQVVPIVVRWPGLKSMDGLGSMGVVTKARPPLGNRALSRSKPHRAVQPWSGAHRQGGFMDGRTSGVGNQSKPRSKSRNGHHGDQAKARAGGSEAADGQCRPTASASPSAANGKHQRAQ